MTYEEYEKIRDSLGLSNNAVAARSGVSTATLSQWKNGKYEPKESTIAQLEAYLDFCMKKAENKVYLADFTYAPSKDKEPILVERKPPQRRYKFIVESYSILLNMGQPVELTKREYEELKKAAEAFTEAWLRMHHKI